MQDLELLSRLLGVVPPWRMVSAELKLDRGRVEALVEYEGDGECPICHRPAPRHDHRERTWRHLDLFQYAFFVTARVPRVRCGEHGLQQLPVPWAEGRSGFTALFEHVAISLLREMSIVGVARHLQISWDEVDGIMQRAVERGLSRRSPYTVRFLGIDEKTVKKRHRYFTIVSDLERGTVLYVSRGRKREALDAFWAGLSPEQLDGIEGIAMDMWVRQHKPAWSQAVKVRCDEGVANRISPEPCVYVRESMREASVGERVGQPLSRVRHNFRALTSST